MSTRALLFILLMVFAITLAIVVGSRLSNDALPIAFGIAVGMVVGMPTSVLVAIMTRQATFGAPVQVIAAQDLATPSGNGSPASTQANNGNGNAKQVAAQPHYEAQSHESAPLSVDDRRQFTVVGGASAPLLEGDFPGNGGHH